MKKILLCIALLFGSLVFNVTPASAHYDDWHQATCQNGGAALWYYWPSSYGGTRVTYWEAYEINYVNVDVQFLSYYDYYGYECGWLGEVRTPAWVQQVCEFGYCGQGTIQAFEHGQIVRHFGGPSAGQVAGYSY